MSNAYLYNDDGQIIIIADGRFITVPADHPHHEDIRWALETKDYDEAIRMADVKEALRSFLFQEVERPNGTLIQLEEAYDGTVLVNERPLPDVVGKKALQMLSQGYSAVPLIRFLDKLNNAGNDLVREGLLAFLGTNNLYIDHDGLIVAYKKVTRRPDGQLVDSWTQSINYTPPRTVVMPRESVVYDPENACAQGLHFATWDYAYNYPGSTMVELRVDPQNVISIPYSEQEKGRCCEFHIEREIPDWHLYKNAPPIPLGAIQPPRTGV